MSDAPEGLTPEQQAGWRRLNPEGQAVWQHVFGSESPIQAAFAFVSKLVGASDVAGAWELTDANFRLCAARQWLWHWRVLLRLQGVDLDEAAAELAEPNTDYPLWAPFEQAQLASVAEFWSWVRVDHLGALSDPRPIGPDLEVVIFVDGKYWGVVSQAPTVIPESLPFVMRLTPSGWLGAGIGEQVPVADWPAEPQEGLANE
jgi:hypothetical protein